MQREKERGSLIGWAQALGSLALQVSRLIRAM